MGNREKILEALKAKGDAMTSRELSEATKMPLSSVYYNTTILVYANKIKRKSGISGLFELVEEN